MRKIILTTLLLSILLSFQCKNAPHNTESSDLILMNSAYLENTKAKIQQSNPDIKPAFDQLILEAESAMLQGPFSVTNKEKLPPSGNKHDYASYSRYWWPDTTKATGLPYIRRDGETNPQSQSLKEADRQRIGSFGENTEILGLAYYLTEEEKYAKKAAELIRVWFLDESTFMNPNLNHAQCRPGHNLGTKSGVLDGRILIKALESSLLISEAGVLDKDELSGLKIWASQYLDWLTKNEMALQEAKSKNNHGSYYDVQTLYFALYSDRQEFAKEIAESFYQRRILSQIKPDGSMPKEQARTRPLFYSVYNLHAMFLVASLAQKVDIDIWKAEDENSRLHAALDFLAPYADTQKQWPTQTLGHFDRMEILTILEMAEIAYPDGNYMEAAEKIPRDLREIHRSNLVVPLMR